MTFRYHDATIHPCLTIMHPVHIRLSNRFKTDSNRFDHPVNASKKAQIDFKPIWPQPTCEKIEIGLDTI